MCGGKAAFERLLSEVGVFDLFAEPVGLAGFMVREERFSFCLPTATDYFYPDYVCELADGRVLVVEYKGEVYRTNDDSREKNQIGHQWEVTSGGKCLFLMAVVLDDRGRKVEKQIANKIVGVSLRVRRERPTLIRPISRKLA